MEPSVWSMLPADWLGPQQVATGMADRLGLALLIVDEEALLVAAGPLTAAANLTEWWASVSNPLGILRNLPAQPSRCWLGQREVLAVSVFVEALLVGYLLLVDPPEAADAVLEAVSRQVRGFGEYMTHMIQAQRSLNKLARLARLGGGAAYNTTSQAELMAGCANSLELIQGAISGFVALVDPNTGGLHIAAHWGQNPGGPDLRPGEGVSGWVVREGQPLVIADLSRDPRIAALYPDPSQYQMPSARSMAVYPLKEGRSTFGVLAVIRNTTRPFTSDSIHYLAAMAGGLSAILHSQRLAERLRRQFLRMGAVAEVARVISQPEADEVVYQLLTEMSALLLPEPAALLALNADGGLIMRGVYGISQSAAAEILLRLEQLELSALGDWSPQILPGERPVYAFPLYGHTDLFGYLALPLGIGPVPDDDLQILGAVARTAASALTWRLARVHAGRGALAAFSRLIAAREELDPSLAGHSERVGQLARKLGARLGLSPVEADALGEAGRMHDLGLHLIGGLHSEPVVGDPEQHQAAFAAASLLERFWSGGAAAAAIRHSHERFDGLGPGGLSGESISLGARILAVAEYYDLLLRPGTGRDSALRSVHELAGSAFDPLVVQTLHGVVLGGPQPRPEAPDRLSGLTARELEVLDCVARGLNNRAIASALFISEATVKVHLGHVFKKLGIQDRTQAALLLRGHRFTVN